MKKIILLSLAILQIILFSQNFLYAQPDKSWSKEQLERYNDYMKDVDKETKDRSDKYQREKKERESSDKGFKNNSNKESKTQVASLQKEIKDYGKACAIGGGVGTYLGASGGAPGALAGGVYGCLSGVVGESMYKAIERQKQIEETNKKAAPNIEPIKSNKCSSIAEIQVTKSSDWDD